MNTQVVPDAAVRPRPMGLPIPNSKLAMWLFLGTEIMFFTGLIGSYIVLRFGSEGWPTDPAVTHINVLAGGVNTFVLICSSYLVVLCHERLSRGLVGQAQLALLGALLLGGLFLGIKSVEYQGKFEHGIIPGQIPETDQQALDQVSQRLEETSRNWLRRLIPEADTPLQKQQLLEEKLTDEGDADTAELRAWSDFEKTRVILRDRIAAETVTLGPPAAHSTAAPDTRPMSSPAVPAETESAPESETETEAATPDGAEPVPTDLDHALASGGIRGAIDWLHQDPRFAAETRHLHVTQPIVYGNLFASLYFFLTGIHALHVVIGLLLFLTILVWGPFLKTTAVTYVENVGLYWHFVDLVWIFLFPLIYIL